MKQFLAAAAMLGASLAAGAQPAPIHVAVDGDDNAAGTAAAPYATIQKAVDAVQPGGTIYVHPGTYSISKRIVLPEKATTADSRIRLFAYGQGEVIIDGAAMNPASVMEFKMARCMYIPYWANYWHIKGITFQNAKDNGMKIEGSYNIIENCVFRDNNDTGLQIGMFKDWSIEEMKSFPTTGTPEFNPGYAYCRENKVINCDAYNNYDSTSFGGTDDGGDADGFACKLFPGPGTEFHGCRAWNNSDDNWDLYMVYHPVVIADCRAWNAGKDKNGSDTPGNGNGFKLGGGGSSGGAAFSQSVGAHVVTNCVSFNNRRKGFDQNNAYEGMYLFNCVAWGNEFNYRFPTVFQYGGMHIRNCVGFNAVKANHEFLSANKEGSKVPDTDFNSWTTIDGCDAYKDGNKVGKVKVNAKDHSGEFLSMLEADAKAQRLPDGSLPENNFCRLKAGSVFIDKGEIVDNFTPARFLTESQAQAVGLELVTAAPVSIEYNGASADMGSFESGESTRGRLYLVEGELEQQVFKGNEIRPVTIKWGGAATDVTVTGAESLNVVRNAEAKTVTISGAPAADVEAVITTEGGETPATMTLKVSVSDVAPATLSCISGNASQTVFYDEEIAPIVFEWGGGATSAEVADLPEGLTYAVENNTITITGIPAADGKYTVTALGGMAPVSASGTITREARSKVLTGDWYHIQDEFGALPADLQDVVALENMTEAAWKHQGTESDGTVPAGCTQGHVDVAKGGGALVWRLPSLLELKANIHFTGGRTLEVRWAYEGQPEQSWKSSKLKKATMTNWNLMSAAGIQPTDKPVTVKFVNDNGNTGGIRVYDFYAKVHDKNSQSGVAAVTGGDFSWYQTGSAIVLQSAAGISSAALYALDGSMVGRTVKGSSVLPLNGAGNGLYVLRAVDGNGKTMVRKIMLK